MKHFKDALFTFMIIASLLIISLWIVYSTGCTDSELETLENYLQGTPGQDGFPELIVYKELDETINNSSTLQNDDELILPIGANETWIFELHILYNSSAVADLKLAWSIPASAGGFWADWGTTGTQYPLTSTRPPSGYGQDAFYDAHGWIRNGPNSGNVTLQWAQKTSEASNTTILSDSYIIAVELPN